MTQTVFLSAPLNGCDELATLYANTFGPEKRREFSLFVSDYWMALGDAKNGKLVGYPSSWSPHYLQTVTNALHRYADKLGHRVVFERPLVENPLDKGVPGIEVTELRGSSADQFMLEQERRKDLQAARKPAKSIIDPVQLEEAPLLADARQVAGDHYKKLKVQPWDAMEAWLTREEFIGFLKGNVIKYMARANSGKEPHDVMIAKAAHYQQKLDEVLEAGSGNKN